MLSVIPITTSWVWKSQHRIFKVIDCSPVTRFACFTTSSPQNPKVLLLSQFITKWISSFFSFICSCNSHEKTLLQNFLVRHCQLPLYCSLATLQIMLPMFLSNCHKLLHPTTSVYVQPSNYEIPKGGIVLGFEFTNIFNVKSRKNFT